MFNDFHLKIFFIVTLIFCALSVRPAQAALQPIYTGTFQVAGVNYSTCQGAVDGRINELRAYDSNVSFTSWIANNQTDCRANVNYFSSNQIIAVTVITSSPSCPANSTLSGSVCSCNIGYQEQGTSCVQGASPLQQSAQSAKDAALAAGKSAAAAQAAYDAVMAHPVYQGACSSCQAGLGAAAATNYDRAVAEGLNAASAAKTASHAADWYSEAIIANAFDAEAQQIAQTAADAHIAFIKAEAIAGTLPTAKENASLAAGALAVGAILSGVTGGSSLATAMLWSASLHAGIFAANVDSSNPQQKAAATTAGAKLIGSTANPFQVTIVEKAAVSAATAAANTASANAGADAAVSVITAPESSWAINAATEATHIAAATAGAKAAVTGTETGQTAPVIQQAVKAAAGAVYSGLSASAATVAADAAALATQSGFSSAQAQTAGVQAAATFSLGGGVGAASAVAAGVGSIDGTATESTLQKVLDAIKSPFTDPEKTLGAIPEADTIPTETPQFTYSPEVFASVAGCPAPISMGFSIGGYTNAQPLSYQPFCDWATILRPLFLALGAIAAFIIFAGLMGL